MADHKYENIIFSPEYMQIIGNRVEDLKSRIEKAESFEEIKQILFDMAQESPSPETVEIVKSMLKKRH